MNVRKTDGELAAGYSVLAKVIPMTFIALPYVLYDFKKQPT